MACRISHIDNCIEGVFFVVVFFYKQLLKSDVIVCGSVKGHIPDLFSLALSFNIL